MACLTPFTARKKDMIQSQVPVPCGKCPECLKRRISGWSFRLMKEGERSSSAHFITLTYDTKHVPITKNGFMDLRKKDLQDFFKRLRKASEKSKSTLSIKYYACGEYGGNTKRPHYHIILFNAQVQLVQAAWPKGQIHYGTVSGASIGYTLKYMSKPSKIPLHRNDDRVREFSLMSKLLGANYLTPQISRWHKNDLDARMHIVLKDGKKIAMPRYFKDKLYTEEERKRIAFFSKQEYQKLTLSEMQTHGQDYYFVKNSEALAKFQRLHYDATQGRNKV